jgi:drug/metabolite transporter (DMT)-like permease
MSSTTILPVQKTLSLTSWALLLLLALIWGGSFTANKAALAEVGVLTTVAFRVSGATLALWIFVLVRGLPVPRGWRWLGTCLMLGILNNVLPFTLIVWGQTQIASGLAAILNATTALFSVLLAALLYRDEALTRRRGLGLALGLAGVVVVIGPAALAGVDLTSLAQLAVLAAAVSYASAAVIARRALAGIRAEVGAAGMLSAAALVMVPLALWQEGLPTLAYSAEIWGALAYLALVASAFAYMIFYLVLSRAGAGNLGLVTLLIAPFAILFGALAFGESLSPRAYAGFALLAAGMLVIDGRLFRHRA